jgi:hypothetical protein
MYRPQPQLPMMMPRRLSNNNNKPKNNSAKQQQMMMMAAAACCCCMIIAIAIYMYMNSGKAGDSDSGIGSGIGSYDDYTPPAPPATPATPATPAPADAPPANGPLTLLLESDTSDKHPVYVDVTGFGSDQLNGRNQRTYNVKPGDNVKVTCKYHNKQGHLQHDEYNINYDKLKDFGPNPTTTVSCSSEADLIHNSGQNFPWDPPAKNPGGKSTDSSLHIPHWSW